MSGAAMKSSLFQNESHQSSSQSLVESISILTFHHKKPQAITKGDHCFSIQLQVLVPQYSRVQFSIVSVSLSASSSIVQLDLDQHGNETAVTIQFHPMSASGDGKCNPAD
jgi:hypothetical protein